MARILVTGGAGFLGAALCEKLLQRGDSVICLDNFWTGRPENIRSLALHPRFAFYERDVCRPLDVDVDEIFNLACPASPRHYQADPINTLKTSVLGVLNMLELARRSGAKFLQASTSEVYGNPHIHPQTENYCGNVSPVGIRACYDEGKRAAETAIYDYQRQYGLDVRVARIFNTYGPGMDIDDGRVVANFIVQALSGNDITIYGDGQQTRSFCYRDDLLEGLVRLMDAPDEVSFPVNIGNPQEFTVRQLAELVLEATGSRSKMIHMPLPSDDPLQRCPDIALARTWLNWMPRIALRDGLRRTIGYFEEQVKPAVAA
ncbi:SDR family oxidoreductase [Rhizobium sp. LjRoot30]|uniref:UDP-glucuronic acid decarboxylase family protein n=1 Tax=Rhizobium sp. LjRoot30 TaxID=3342320 RepID=UPI003ECD031A